MISSGEEAIAVLKKWEAESTLLHLIMTDVGFKLSVFGTITSTAEWSFGFQWEQGNMDIQIMSYSSISYEEPRDPPEYYKDKYKYLAWLDIKTEPLRRLMILETAPID